MVGRQADYMYALYTRLLPRTKFNEVYISVMSTLLPGPFLLITFLYVTSPGTNILKSDTTPYPIRILANRQTDR